MGDLAKLLLPTIYLATGIFATIYKIVTFVNVADRFQIFMGKEF